MKRLFLQSVLIVLIINSGVIAQSTVGPNYPNSSVTGGGGGVAWTNPGNVSADDNSYTTASIGNTGTSQALYATDFNFSTIPDDATIAGIEVAIGRYSSTTNPNLIKDNTVQLLKSGSAIGDNKAVTGTNWPNESEGEGEATYGGPGELWGTTWSPAEIKASNFGLELIVDNSGFNSHIAYVDYIRITVYLAGPPAGEPTTQASGVSFSSVGSTQMTVNWTSGDGTNRIVLVRSGSQVNSDPVDGVSYTANATFGSGSQIGSGNYVVYDGTGNSVIVNGLSPNTTYYVAVYEFNGYGGSQNYLTTNPATGSQLTNTAPITANFTGQELLGRPTDHSITLNVVSSSAIQAYIEYGTTSGTYTNTTLTESQPANEPVVIVIDGLTADTKYYYKLVYSADAGSTWVERDEHSFRTQRPPGDTFTFDITSDSHVNILLGSASTWQQTLTNVKSDNPDFLIDCGDTFAMDNVNSESGARTAYLFQRTSTTFGLVSPSFPVFLAAGNHEEQEAWHLDDNGNPVNSQPVWGTNAQKRYFLNPIPDNDFYTGNSDTYPDLDGDQLREDYYAWTWGDALFVVIDPFWYTYTKPFTGNTGGGEGSDVGSGDRWDWTLGDAQYNWLKQTLENSTATYKFLFMHHMTGGTDDYIRGGAYAVPYCEWGGYDENGTTYSFNTRRPGWSQTIEQILVDNGVTAVFHGHDHQYAYEIRDGIVYQSLPAAGFSGNGFNIYNSSNSLTLSALPSPGHLRLTVSPTQTTVDYINTSSGDITYSYTIDPISITVNTKIFLQGPYNSGSGLMSTAINSGLPTTQPYNGSPWNYNGSESVTGSFFSSHTDIVDWVLVEIKNSSFVTEGRRAAFLKSNGTLVDIDGTSPVVFKGRPDGNYYIVIKHRNHLAIMSANPVTLPNGSAYDFTTGATQYYGGEAADLGGGVYGMYSGDTDGDGTINYAVDLAPVWNERGQSGYLEGDTDMDGTVNSAVDRAGVWNNSLKDTSVPN